MEMYLGIYALTRRLLDSSPIKTTASLIGFSFRLNVSRIYLTSVSKNIFVYTIKIILTLIFFNHLLYLMSNYYKTNYYCF